MITRKREGGMWNGGEGERGKVEWGSRRKRDGGIEEEEKEEQGR